MLVLWNGTVRVVLQAVSQMPGRSSSVSRTSGVSIYDMWARIYADTERTNLHSHRVGEMSLPAF